MKFWDNSKTWYMNEKKIMFKIVDARRNKKAIFQIK